MRSMGEGATRAVPAGGELLEREHEVDALAGARRGDRVGRREARRRRGACGNRQDAAARRGAPARGRRGPAGAERARRGARAGVRVRRRPPAVRAGARRRGARGRAARPARRRQRRASSSRSRRRAGSEADGSFAVLHGLYWLTVNLSAERPLAARDRRPALVRPPVAPLPRLPRAAARGAAGARRSRACARPSPASTRRCSPSSLGDPLEISLHPRPLSETGGRRRSCARRLGDEADPAFAAACHAATGGNPLLLNELLKALEAEGVRPDADTSRRCASSARARPRVPCCFGSRGSAATRSPWRGRSRCSATAPTSAASRRSRASTTQVAADGGPRARAGGDPATRAAARLRAPARRAAPSTRTSRRASASSSTSARHGCSTRPARRRSRLPRTCSRSPPRGEDVGGPTLRRAAAPGAAQGRAGERGRATSRRALVEPPPAELAGYVLLELGVAEALTSGPAAAGHLRAGVRAARRSAAARERRAATSGARCSSRARRRRRRGRARARRPTLPPELDDLRPRARGGRARDRRCSAPATSESLRGIEHSPARPRRGSRARRCSRAVAAIEWTYTGGPREQCAELALHALAGGELIAADNGGFFAIARDPAARRRRPRRGADRLGRRVRAMRTAAARCSPSRRDPPLARLHALRRGELAEAQRGARERPRRLRDLGLRLGSRSVYVSGFLALRAARARRPRRRARALERGGEPADSPPTARATG